MSFTKLDEDIIMSSVFQESEVTFKTWIALLATCKQNGISKATIPFLAGLCKTTYEKVEEAIDTLSKPDKYSKSDIMEGARIVKVDGGFFIVNYKKYRERTYSDDKDAVRMRGKRAEEKENQVKNINEQGSNNVRSSSNKNELKGTSLNISASASASTSVSPSSSEIINTPVKVSVDDNKKVIVPEKKIDAMPVVDEPSEYYKLAVILKNHIKASGTSMLFKESHLAGWEKVFKLMVERDKRPGESIKQKMVAIYEDTFWSQNIRSADKLRVQWNEGKLDKLSGDAGEGPRSCEVEEGAAKPYPGSTSVYTKLVAACGAVLGNSSWKEFNFFPSGSVKERDAVWRHVWEIMCSSNPKEGLNQIIEYLKSEKAKNEFSESEY